MIMEVLDPECEAVCSSKFLAQISQVRKEVSSRLGTPHSTKPEPIQMLKTLFAPGMILMRFSFWGGHPSKARNAGTSQFLKRILSAQCFQEIQLTNGDGTVPIQFQYSDGDHGPGKTRNEPAPFAGDLQQS